MISFISSLEIYLAVFLSYLSHIIYVLFISHVNIYLAVYSCSHLGFIHLFIYLNYYYYYFTHFFIGPQLFLIFKY